jgi:hypothetical protein
MTNENSEILDRTQNIKKAKLSDLFIRHSYSIFYVFFTCTLFSNWCLQNTCIFVISLTIFPVFVTDIVNNFMFRKEVFLIMLIKLTNNLGTLYFDLLFTFYLDH